jgi:cytochrome c2
MDRLKTFSVKHFKKLVLVFALLSFGFNGYAQPDGEKLFKANCTSCHKATDQKLVGPGLKGVRGRWGNDDAKLIKWVQNSQAYLKTGDSYANNLFKEYNQSIMPNQTVSADEVVAILDYIDSYVDPTPPPPTADAGVANTANKEETNWTYIWIGLGLFFVILIIILAPVRRNLANSAQAKQGKVYNPDATFWGETKAWIYSHKKPVMLLGFLVFLMLFVVGWNALSGIGVYEGYQPEQPIKFSHKIHAGENKINCQYCHTGVEKSRHANIPSANVCMNCHKYIQEGPTTGKGEIAKIYAALDYNPEKGTYGPNPKPIKWVRIHNLPDLAYFNHSQHVKVGGVECKECHGPIETMDVVQQFSPLTMGWCINCHRETEVKADSTNLYYTDLKAKFNAVHPGEKFTVEQIGGLECGKCHY